VKDHDDEWTPIAELETPARRPRQQASTTNPDLSAFQRGDKLILYQGRCDSFPAGRAPTSAVEPTTVRDEIDNVATSSYIDGVRSVGVKVLKNKLSEYVRLAAGGETVLVTDRDRVVAELGPPRPGRAPLLADALLAEAGREGWISAPLLVAEAPPPRQPVAPWDVLCRELDEDRGER
jgi:antitoxin (DNA-binding transcriptional repressor) of toxin-antitoxin stability system